MNTFFRRRLSRKSWLVVLFLWLLLNMGQAGRDHPILLAAKSGIPLDLRTMAWLAVDEEVARDLALSDDQVMALLSGKSYDFLYATRLGEGETGQWPGCGPNQCAQVTFYNNSDGGTVEAILNLESQEIVSRWAAPADRPMPSNRVLPKAMAIANGDDRVQALLGDLRLAESAMVPMPIWLADDACNVDWCVDLTYHDPAGTGRILHIVVNMEQEVVARTFFSRARPERTYKRPAAQTAPFNNGCHEQYNWSVCWEMTANDGLNFRVATYNGQTIFSSLKIGQTEVWYPAWPGGYRDEIGFNASVPPHFGTLVEDLEYAFEVRQLYTEFLRWPNCICCYRYEQVLRFYADGAFELRFVSHGPGCEDLSQYRPMWRIDLDLGGPENDQVWQWQDLAWVEVDQETEINLFSDSGPAGQQLVTFDGDLNYRWRPIATDPLGLDGGKFFILKANEQEGEAGIRPGPADTYQPPRQWLNGEAASGENIVIWYVPILRTKKGGPWWCMPDPDPEFTPCESILRIEPGEELRQPTAEELAQLQATPTPAPTLELALFPSPTPRPVSGEDAASIILNAGCGACHAIGNLGEVGKVGPDLSNIGQTAGERVAGLTAAEYLHQSIVEPNAYIAPECPNGPCLAGIMPQDYGQRLTSGQIEALVIFLAGEEPAGPTPTLLPAGATPPAPTMTIPPVTIGEDVPPQTPIPAGTSESPAPAPNFSSALLPILIVTVLLFISLGLFRQWQLKRQTNQTS